MTKRLLAVCMVVTAGLGCSRGADLDEVPIGSEVQLTRQDGGVVEGKLTARDEQTVKVDVGRDTRSVARDEVAHIGVADESGKTPELPPIARFREYTVPSGTRLSVQLEEAVGSATSNAGDTVSATLANDVTIDGAEVLPAGSAVRARVSEAERSGKVKGRARLSLTFTGVTAHGETYSFEERYTMVAPGTKARDAKTIGIPAAGGAVIGAIVGGGKGAAIGAAVGGGAGTGVVLATRGKEVGLASGAKVPLTLDRPLEVRVPIMPKSDS
jgi:outer membrane lipoprotein SlyB